MKKYTANYANTNPNFVIQNLDEDLIESEYLSVYYVLKNLLQRGFPTLMSKYLKSELKFSGGYQKSKSFKENYVLISKEKPVWHHTIKGGKDFESKIFFEGEVIETLNPAKFFFEKIIPTYFGEYAFIQQLILPEIRITDITSWLNNDKTSYINEIKNIFEGAARIWSEEEENKFVRQQVDFFLPQAKLVIEIDGLQHEEPFQSSLDEQRDLHLAKYGIKTVRIRTSSLKNGTYRNQIIELIEFLETRNLSAYKSNFSKSIEDLSDEQFDIKVIPTAIMRFQILVLDLLITNRLSLDDPEWKFNLNLAEEYRHHSFIDLAIRDLFIWLRHLCQLRKLPFSEPHYEITYSKIIRNYAINIDFSLLKRYTDENELEINKRWIFVRTDYFGFNFGLVESGNKNYFKASTTTPVSYQIINDNPKDVESLVFFLQNIFEHMDFRDGQLAIIANALNFYKRDSSGNFISDEYGKPETLDTIGLLPTGGGKSICYQLPCLLQPTINFVVCPIKSLMYDQKRNLDNSLITNTNYISSDLSQNDREKVQLEFSQGRYLFVWISPERFQSKIFRKRILEVNEEFSMAYAVIDEVHCLSEWGHDFRTSYLNLAKTIRRFCPSTNFIGLTATASVNVLKDISIEFGIKQENVKTQRDFSREELFFNVINDNGNKQVKLNSLLNQWKDEGLFEHHEHKYQKACLTFTPHVNDEYGCYNLSKKISRTYPKSRAMWYSGSMPKLQIPIFVNANKIATPASLETTLKSRLNDAGIDQKLIDKVITNAMYVVSSTKNPAIKQIKIHDGLNVLDNDTVFQGYKHDVQKWFSEDKFPLMVATKAFGMGIDKKNIYYTIHYGLPGSIEALYQEAGRAGRWENKAQKAECCILFSPEVVSDGVLNQVFNPNISLDELNDVIKSVGFSGRDIFRVLFLMLNNQKDIEQDAVVVNYLIDSYYRENAIATIDFGTAQHNLFLKGIGTKKSNGTLVPFDESKTGIIQKAIYRLSLLGIVKDWTTDFRTSYEVEFDEWNDKSILQKLTNHILKYKPDAKADKVKKEILNIPKPTIRERCIVYLLGWIWEEIVASRRQGLKDLYELCKKYPTIGNDGFKKAIDEKFRFDETTFAIQHIAEHTDFTHEWYNIFFKDGVLLNNEQIETLKNQVSRFLIDYRSSIGLNLMSGFVRLFLNDYEDSDGRLRLENALAQIHELERQQRRKLFNSIIYLGKYLPENNRIELVMSIDKFYPPYLELFAISLELNYLLPDFSNSLEQSMGKMNQLNKLLYGKITEV